MLSEGLQTSAADWLRCMKCEVGCRQLISVLFLFVEHRTLLTESSHDTELLRELQLFCDKFTRKSVTAVDIMRIINVKRAWAKIDIKMMNEVSCDNTVSNCD